MEAKVLQLKSVTGLGDADARRLLAQCGSVEVAADVFFSGEWEQEMESDDDEGEAVDASAIDAWFDRLKDPSSGSITDDGIERFCRELGLDPEDPLVLAISWHMDAKEMCIFTREEWQQGMRRIGADSPERLRAALPVIAQEVADPASDQFRQLYTYAFDFAREGSKKTIGLDEAATLWEILFKGKEVPLLNDFIAYLRQQASEKEATAAAAASAMVAAAKAAGMGHVSPPLQPMARARVTKDTWTQALDFFLMADLSKYDENDAWPSVVDDFVEHYRAKQSGGRKTK